MPAARKARASETPSPTALRHVGAPHGRGSRSTSAVRAHRRRKRLGNSWPARSAGRRRCTRWSTAGRPWPRTSDQPGTRRCRSQQHTSRRVGANASGTAHQESHRAACGGHAAEPVPGATQTEVVAGVSSASTTRSRSCSRRSRLPGRRLPSDQAEDRAWLGRRAGGRPCASGSVTRCCSRWTRTRLHPGRCPPPRPAGRVRPVADRTALDEEDVAGHAVLADVVRTPICLDESIVSAQAAFEAIRIGACSISTFKPAGSAATRSAPGARRLRGGRGPGVGRSMLRDRLGRAANLALAGLSNFTLPSTSPAPAATTAGLTEPFTPVDGRIPVPTGPGIGVTRYRRSCRVRHRRTVVRP